MESNELLASLAKMEASLNEVESARKQVESTVNASSELQKEVREYVSAVKALCVKLQSWESDLRTREGSLSHEFEEAITRVGSTCVDVVRSFETEVEKTSTDFKTKIEHEIEKITEQNDKLAERVAELVALREQIKEATTEIESVKGSLELISKDLKESQNEQDIALDEIKTKVSVLPTIIQQSLESITQAVSRSEQTLAETLNQINGKTDTLAINIANLTTLCQSVNSTITSSANNLTNVINNAKDDTLRTIKESQDEITKVSNIDRWIMIIGFIIVIIMFFVIK